MYSMLNMYASRSFDVLDKVKFMDRCADIIDSKLYTAKILQLTISKGRVKSINVSKKLDLKGILF